MRCSLPFIAMLCIAEGSGWDAHHWLSLSDEDFALEDTEVFWAQQGSATKGCWNHIEVSPCGAKGDVPRVVYLGW